MKNNEMDRHEKLEFLLETCTPDFIKDCFFLRDLVASLSEEEFDKCYNFICRQYNIAKSYEDLSQMMFEKDTYEDPMNDFNYVGSKDHY